MMNRVIYCILVSYTLIGCTSYDTSIKYEVQNFQTLTPDNIITELKVVNLIIDQDEFDEMYADFEEDIEVEGQLNLYKNGTALIENELIEVEIKGSFSSTFDLKTLGIKFDDTYDNSEGKLIDPQKLPFHALDKVKAFRLRNSGNDFMHTMLKDMSYTKLAIDAGLNIDLTYAEQSVVFLNGQFLGLMNLRTEANTNGMSRLYDVSKKDITLAKIEDEGELDKKDGDFERIDAFIEAISDKDFDYLVEEIDVANFIDYMIFESYIGNRDWPKNNVRFFAIEDGPFRFVLFDLDLVATHDISDSPLSFINHPSANPITDLFNVMYANVDFKRRYDDRYDALLASGVLSFNKFNEIVDSYKRNIEHIMPTQINKYTQPASLTDWYINIDQLKYNFKQRADYLK